MNTYETTPERTLELLREAVNERGKDYVYQNDPQNNFGNPLNESTCLYVRPSGSGPACIAGVVFHKYGVPLETLKKKEGRVARGVASDLGFDAVSSMLLSEAQCAQDSGQTWGKALEHAEGTVETV